MHFNPHTTLDISLWIHRYSIIAFFCSIHFWIIYSENILTASSQEKHFSLTIKIICLSAWWNHCPAPSLVKSRPLYWIQRSVSFLSVVLSNLMLALGNTRIGYCLRKTNWRRTLGIGKWKTFLNALVKTFALLFGFISFGVSVMCFVIHFGPLFTQMNDRIIFCTCFSNKNAQSHEIS